MKIFCILLPLVFASCGHRSETESESNTMETIVEQANNPTLVSDLKYQSCSLSKSDISKSYVFYVSFRDAPFLQERKNLGLYLKRDDIPSKGSEIVTNKSSWNEDNLVSLITTSDQHTVKETWSTFETDSNCVFKVSKSEIEQTMESASFFFIAGTLTCKKFSLVEQPSEKSVDFTMTVHCKGAKISEGS